MAIFEGEMDRVLTLLRQKIRERGYTQLEVQKELSWGRSYISQLLTKQKALRVEQVLLILRVIGVDPGDFFLELYPPAASGAPWTVRDRNGSTVSGRRTSPVDSRADSSDPNCPARGSGNRRAVGELRALVRGLVGLLADKELIDLDDLTSAVRDSQTDWASPGLKDGKELTPGRSSH